MSRSAFLSYTSEFAESPAPDSFVDAASSGIIRAGFRPMEMSYLTATDRPPHDACAAMVDECEVFVALVGFRYGSVVSGRPEMSYVEHEFDVATAARRQRLIFLLAEDASSLPAGSIIDRRFGHRQDEFRQRLRTSDLVVAEFNDVVQLELMVYQSLMQVQTSRRRMSLADERDELRRELALVVASAEAQGWRIKTNSVSALRLVGPDGTTYSFPIGEAHVTRDELRAFARRLSDAGLRLNGSLLSPVGAPPANPYA